MQQEIWVQASATAIVKGIAEFKNIMYKKQSDIKPEVYLPIFAYLDKYAKSLYKSAEQKVDENIKQIKTIVHCNNSDIISIIPKISKLLYNQTNIEPEVYLHILDKINEYVEILVKQEKGLPIPLKQVEEEQEQKVEKESSTDEPEDKSKPEKDNNVDIKKLKSFF